MISVKEEFFIRKKDKAFLRFLKKWFSGKEVSDIEVAKNLSSFLTHSLIDMEGMSTPMYERLDIPEQSSMLNSFIQGDVTRIS